MSAHNFLAFKDLYFSFESLKHEPYLITGTSDYTSSRRNGVGKTAFAVEILTWTLYGTLARGRTRSSEALIHDPSHTGKGKDMICQVCFACGGQEYIVQRYVRHPELGSGSRVLSSTTSPAKTPNTKTN
jgi:DNA repair exonuclease SbcCD ATPase subunit